MKKKIVLVLLLGTLLTANLTGCNALDSLDTTKGFKYIAEGDVPTDYKDTGSSYYYNEVTGVVYVCFDQCIVKLESADYEFYIYDKQNNEFVGYNH